MSLSLHHFTSSVRARTADHPQHQHSAAFAVPVEDDSHVVQIVKWKMLVDELLESQLQTPDWFNHASL